MAKVSVDDFVSALKEWTVVDVMNAIKAIETEFGVTAAAPVAVAAARPQRHRRPSRPSSRWC